MSKPRRTVESLDAELKAKPQLTITLSIGKLYQPMMRRYVKLVNDYPNTLSISALMVTAAAACIDTFEKEIPKGRRFKLNNCIVEV